MTTKMEAGYTKRVSYDFEIDGEGFSVTDWSNRSVTVEETRKNGQEDCHFYAELFFTAGKWKMEPYARQNCAEHYFKTTADKIEAHLDRWGPPTD